MTFYAYQGISNVWPRSTGQEYRYSWSSKEQINASVGSARAVSQGNGQVAMYVIDRWADWGLVFE